MSTYLVPPNVRSVTLSSGDVMSITSGGTASFTIVNGDLANVNPAIEYVYFGGTAIQTTVDTDGTEVVSSGGTASGTTVIGTVVTSDFYEAASQDVFFGGITISTTLIDGGGETVWSGGRAISTTVNNGGGETVLLGGRAISTTVNSGGSESVDTGGTVSGTTVNSSGFETVSGTATGTTVNSGGDQIVVSGGTASGTTVNGGGQAVNEGAAAVSTTVSGGGYQSVSGTAIDTTVDDGGQEDVAGTVTSTTVNAGGQETVDSGGTASATQVNSGGFEFVSAGGTAVGATVSSDGAEFVFPGGTTIGTTVISGGYLFVAPGGVVRGVLVQPGGAVVSTGVVFDQVDSGITVYTGSANDIVAGSEEAVVVFPGGTAIGDTLTGYYAIQLLYSGGTASDTTVSSGSFDYVSSGGTAVSTTVNSGGAEIVFSGGTASSSKVNRGGVEIVLPGGNANGTVVSAGGTFVVVPGGVASATTGAVVSTGVVLYQSEPEVTSDLIVHRSSVSYDAVSAGDSEFVMAGGKASFTTVSSGGAETVFSRGTTSFTTVSSGGTQIVSSGGTASFTTVSNGGTQVVSSGGTASGTIVNSGGVEIVLSGGTADADPVESGGVEIVSSGGTDIDNTVSSGGAIVLLSGGIVSGTDVESGGHLVVLPGGAVDSPRLLASNAVVSTGVVLDQPLSGVTVYGVSATDVVVGSGATEYVLAGGTANGDTVLRGGTEEVYGAASGTTVSRSGVEDVESGGFATSTTVNPGGSIDVSYLTYVSGGTANFDPTTNVLLVTEGANSYTQHLAGDYTGETFDVSPDAPAGTGTLITLESAPCFCRGTLILTDHGERPVESLRIGDHLITLSGAARPILWIGHRHLDLSRHPTPEWVQPILICASAVADGIPRRDLRVSPDHALLLDGGLIPARLLVNGASIQRDVQCRTVTYYHIELETHDILLAESLPAESYLDTGNRGTFENADAPLILHPDRDDGQRQRGAASCRPFVVDPASVEPVWRRLATRAVLLGLRLPAPPKTTDEPALHLVAGGRTIKPVSAEAGRYRFVLSNTDGPVRLVSRVVSPCELRPWLDDRRRLGVQVSRLTLKSRATVQPIPLDHPDVSAGWWDIEREGAAMLRWTDGNALIPCSGVGPALLEISLASRLDYPPIQDEVHDGTATDRKSARPPAA